MSRQPSIPPPPTIGGTEGEPLGLLPCEQTIKILDQINDESKRELLIAVGRSYLELVLQEIKLLRFESREITEAVLQRVTVVSNYFSSIT